MRAFSSTVMPSSKYYVDSTTSNGGSWLDSSVPYTDPNDIGDKMTIVELEEHFKEFIDEMLEADDCTEMCDLIATIRYCEENREFSC